jgi:hypothetical protein
VNKVSRHLGVWSVAVGLLVTGLVVVALGYRVGSLAALIPVGAVVIGASLTVIVSKVTSEEAVHAQNVKEAILKYKDDLYVPVHSQLKQAVDSLELARQRQAPAPQAIRTTFDASNPQFMSMNDPSEVPFNLWPSFRSDFRRERFSSHASRVLDEALEASEAYTSAVTRAREIITTLLIRHVETVLSEHQHDPWLQEIRVSGTREEQANQIALSWVNTPLGGSQSSAVGWFITRNPDAVADSVHHWFTVGGQSYFPWDLLRGIFQNVFLLFTTGGEPAVFEAERRLYDAMVAAESYLTDRLLFIRDQYEGGQPVV